MQDCVLGLTLCNTFVNGLEGKVKSSLILLTGLLNWEVSLTPEKKENMQRDLKESDSGEIVKLKF